MLHSDFAHAFEGFKVQVWFISECETESSLDCLSKMNELFPISSRLCHGTWSHDAVAIFAASNASKAAAYISVDWTSSSASWTNLVSC